MLSPKTVLLSCVAACLTVGCASTGSDATPASGSRQAMVSPPPAPPPGFKALWNGKDLAGWKAFIPDANVDPATVWKVVDGALWCEGKPAGYIATIHSYTSFELELEWRFDAEKGEGNSGVLLRVQQPDKVWPRSVEAQLQSKSAGDIWNIGDFPMKVAADRTKGRWTGKLKPTNEKPLGEWNRYRIVLKGGELQLFVNGELQNSATGVQAIPGRIALQSEGAHIEFRNIYIKPLD